MPVLIAFPLFSILVIIQAGILSRITLLQSSADVIMLVILSWSLQERVKTSWHWAIIGGVLSNIATNLPFGLLPLVYSAVTGLGIFLRRRIWKAPLITMFIGTFLSSIILYAVSYILVVINGSIIAFDEAINFVVLPGILLNLLLALPVFFLVRDLANWLYPEELES